MNRLPKEFQDNEPEPRPYVDQAWIDDVHEAYWAGARDGEAAAINRFNYEELPRYRQIMKWEYQYGFAQGWVISTAMLTGFLFVLWIVKAWNG